MQNLLNPVGFQPKYLSNWRRISPYLWPQHGLLQKYHLPKLRDLPEGIAYRPKTFDFGFNANTLPLEPYNTQYVSLTQARNLLIWAITGVSAVPFGQTPAVGPQYLFQVIQTHQGDEAQFFNKAMTDGESAGSNEEPFILTEPALILANDQIKVSVQNLANVTLSVQITLHGGEFA